MLVGPGLAPLPQLWVAERSALHPLPLHIPEVYEVHTRRVDVEGYVNLHTNRYSVSTALIGRTVTIRESIDRIRVFDGHAVVTEHERRAVGAHVRVTKPEHLGERRWRLSAPQSPEEQALRAPAPALGAMVDALRKRHGGQALRAVRRLHRLWRDYPTEPVVEAVKVALEHGPGPFLASMGGSVLASAEACARHISGRPCDR